ncbi:hypothetical protein Pint_05557 [Pistacia integerrima]|uniref:Uncharacterized protein n=1 Tax=Pistacia integerrima TaxID=434235 RepID=A0ACC0Z5F4_9ROSI|nr:hypothetical protein Pint_05557 [Pistacia integerrima]
MLGINCSCVFCFFRLPVLAGVAYCPPYVAIDGVYHSRLLEKGNHDKSIEMETEEEVANAALMLLSTNKLRQGRMRSYALKKQLLHQLPTLSIDEEDIVMERDKKFVGENANLREIMEKLMEAGKE